MKTYNNLKITFIKLDLKFIAVNAQLIKNIRRTGENRSFVLIVGISLVN